MLHNETRYKSEPLVSVILPAFNAERFISGAIDSIIGQSFKDFELLVIDDGSTDNTAAIVQGYSDLRIRLIQKENEGVAATLNRGIELAKGQYIWRHDADDISLPEKLQKEVEFLEQHDDCLLVATQVAFMTERGKVAWKRRQPKSHWLGNQPHRWVTPEDFSPFSPITHGTTLIRSKAFILAGPYRQQFITSEDIDMWLRMLEHGELAVLNSCLSLHRLSSASATAVHGWKNEFYRELAKTYYMQRQHGQTDDLEAQGHIKEPTPPSDTYEPAPKSGTTFRLDLLNFHYAVHLDARDWRECMRIIWLAWRSGWRLVEVYKAIVIPLLPQAFINIVTSTKARLRQNHIQS